MPLMDPPSRRGWFTFPVLLPQEIDRDRVMTTMERAGIETADYFTALNRLSGYEGLCVQRSSLDNSDDIGRRLLCLPLWEGLDDATIETIATELSNAIAV